METWEWIVVGIASVVAVLLLLALVRIRRRRTHLRERFGPEYERAVSDAGTQSAERRLSEVERERTELAIRSLPPAARDRYLDQLGDDSERLVALVSVDHPDVADRYRHGHAMLENVDVPRARRLCARP